MNEQFTQYLSGLGMKGPFLERAEIARSFYADAGIQIDDIFVSDLVDNENKRSFASLWFFAKDTAMEAKNFTQAEDFDFCRYDEVTWWQYNRSNFRPGEATESSRLSIDANLIGSGQFSAVTGHLHATGVNCEKLHGIFQKYILKRLVAPN
jgi:hypothetical protein